MANVLWLNNVDVEATLGFRIASLPRWRDGYEVSRALTSVPDSPVSVVGPRTYRSRTLSLSLLVGDDNDTWGERADKLDVLDALCGYGETLVPIRIGDQTDRQISGYLTSRSARPRGTALEWATGFTLEVALDFECPDARWVATTATTLASIGTTAVAVPAGTAPMDARLVIGGGDGTHTVTVLNASGVAVQTMTFVATLTGQTITIRTGSVQDIDTSLATNPYTLWTGWETEQFIRFDPSLWDFRGSNWAGVRVSGATSASMSYVPAWRG